MCHRRAAKGGRGAVTVVSFPSPGGSRDAVRVNPCVPSPHPPPLILSVNGSVPARGE